MNSISFIYIFSLFVITSPNFIFKIPVRSYWISIVIHAVIFSCILYFTYDIVNRDVIESATVNNGYEGTVNTIGDGTVNTRDGKTTVVVESSGTDSDEIKKNTADIEKLEDTQNQAIIDAAENAVQLAQSFADNAAISATTAYQAASQINTASNASHVNLPTSEIPIPPPAASTPVTPTPVTPTPVTPTPVTPVTRTTTTVIDIGRSSTNTKTVQLPHDSMTVSPIPVNKQNPGWKDTFSVTVSGKTLTVKRVDYSGGWGQPLQLSATTRTTPTTPVTPTTPYTRIGSYRDGGYKGGTKSGAKRALPIFKGSNYTQSTCMAACPESKYFAIQFGSQCFCGSSLSEATKYGKKECGDNGAAWCNSLYQNNSIGPT